MKSRRIWLAVLLIFSTSIFIIVPCFAQRGVTENTIKLGLIEPKTGPFAVLSLHHGQGIIDGIEYINDQGGVHGRKIKVLWEDDELEVPKNMAAFKKLITIDNVMTIICCGGTGSTLANIENINKYKVPTIPISIVKEFYEPYQPYIFVKGASYETQFECIVDYIFNDLKEKKPRIGVFYTKKEHGMIGLAATQKRVKAYGVDPISELVLPTGAVDASSQVLNFKGNNIDYVIACDSLPPVITFLKTAQQHNYWPKHVFGYAYASEDMLVKSCGEAAKNYIGATYIGAWWDDSKGIKLVRQIAENYKRTDITLTGVYTDGVGSAMVFVEGLKRAGRDLTPDSLKAALETLREYDTGGVCPPVTYTSTSHAPPGMVKLVKADVPNKRLVAFTDWRKPKKMK